MEKHGKTKKGARHNKKLLVKQILTRVRENHVRLLPFLALALDYVTDGQIDGFGFFT